MGNSLVSFVHQRAGESLRAIAEYEQTDFDLLYYRDDLPRTTIRDRVETVHGNITWAWNPDDDDDEVVAELGKKRATVQVRDEVIIIHLLEGVNHGYLIGLEPDAARNLTTFLGECLNRIQ